MNVLIIGYGRWGEKLTRKFLELLGPERVFVADIDEERLGKVPSGVIAGKDYETMLREQNIRACVVATLPKDHVEVAAHCLATGHSTLVEKPLALSSHDAEMLLQLARNQGVTLMTDDTFMYHPISINGEGQKCKRFVAAWTNPRKVISDEGILWTQGPHPVSLMLRAFGQGVMKPITVTGSLSPRMAVLDYIFSGKRRGTITLDWSTDRYRFRKVLSDWKLFDYGENLSGENEPLRVMAQTFIKRAELAIPWFDEHGVEVVRLLEWTQNRLRAKEDE